MRRLWCLLLILLLAPSCFALGEKSWLTENARNNVVLTDKKGVAELIIDNHDFPGVLRAARNLQSDIAKVTGQTLPLNHQPNGKNIQAVIIGTLGKSQLIDQLVATKKGDVNNIRNQWDA